MNEPPNNFISSGVRKGASKVAIEVSVIDRARFAFARYEITLAATAFGAHPIRIIPAAISGVKPLMVANPNPSKGMIIKWLETPTRTPLGDLNTPIKSL